MATLNLRQLISPVAAASPQSRPPIVAGRLLFAALSSAIGAGRREEIADALGQFEAGMPFWLDHEFVKPHVNSVLHLLRCACLAAGRAEDFVRAQDRPGAAYPNALEWATVRTLLMGSGLLGIEALHSVRVPIAFRLHDNVTGRRNGRLALLEVRIIKKGRGVVAHDPRDAFETQYGEDFGQAVAAAWNLARRGNCEFDGLWRLLPWDTGLFDGRADLHACAAPAYTSEAVNGRSVGAAAWNAWRLALEGKVEDPGVIWMLALRLQGEDFVGEIDGGLLESVDGVADKVACVAAANEWFDTIVVAADSRGPSKRNYSDAVETLGPLAGQIRVVPL